MTEEEKKAIVDQYKKGLVNLENIIEPLIRQFKNDYSLDIQQLRLVTNYLLLEREFNEEYYSELDKELEKLQKEIEEYKRYFKLAISDLQSEGYMQMPFKNIENYYSKREDIVWVKKKRK